MLGAGQVELARAFATKRDDKFDGIRWTKRNGLPYLDGSPGWASCAVAQRLPGGDHAVIIADVEDIEFSDCVPLVYGGRRFGTHSALTGQQ